jgi:hypothetical protein
VLPPAILGARKMTAPSDLAARRAMEVSGAEFMDENGGGLGDGFANATRKSIGVRRLPLTRPSRHSALPAIWICLPPPAEPRVRGRLTPPQPGLSGPASTQSLPPCYIAQ